MQIDLVLKDAGCEADISVDASVSSVSDETNGAEAEWVEFLTICVHPH